MVTDSQTPDGAVSPTSTSTEDLPAALGALYAEYLSQRPHARSQLKDVLSSPRHVQRRLLDQLLCIRDPSPFPAGTTEAVDRILRAELAAADTTDARTLRKYPASVSPSAAPAAVAAPSTASKHYISLFRGDLTLLTSAALVNPANTRMLGCFQPTHKCLDNVLHARAGPSVRLACAEKMETLGVEDMPTGEPILTHAGVLDSPGMIHVAGPQLESGAAPTDTDEAELSRAYARSLDLAAEAGIAAVAFPCISTGIFAYPLKQATAIAVRSVAEWFAAHPDVEMYVTFVLWTAQDEEAYLSTVPTAFPHLSPGALAVQRPGLPADVINWAHTARHIVIHAGAGLSADAVNSTGFGLDYTSPELFESLYPGLRTEGLRCLYDTIGHDWSNRLVQWGFIFAHAHTVLSWGATPVYSRLLNFVAGRDYTVLTSNADNLFAQSGFAPSRICTRQGSYARLQCLEACTPHSFFDAAPWVERALPHLDLADPRVPKHLASKLIPQCPNCGGDTFLNVRGGDWFLDTPHRASEEAYAAAVQDMVAAAEADEGTVLVLELGAGFNTPTVIRMPTEHLAEQHTSVRVVRVNPLAPEFHADLDPARARGVRMGADEFLRLLETALEGGA